MRRKSATCPPEDIPEESRKNKTRTVEMAESVMGVCRTLYPRRPRKGARYYTRAQVVAMAVMSFWRGNSDDAFILDLQDT